MINYTTTGAIPLAASTSILVHGIAGIGKTMLCATAPRPLIVSAEGGMLSLTRANIERVYGVNTPGIIYDIPCVQIKTLDDLTAVIADMKRPAFQQAVDTLCIDSLSEIAERVLIRALESVNDGRQGFGILVDKMMEICRELRDLAKFVYMTTKQGYSEDTRKNGPSLPGKALDRELPYIFDEVFCLTSAESNGKLIRYLKTQSDFQDYAKDRSGALSPEGEPANLSHIFRKISGHL